MGRDLKLIFLANLAGSFGDGLYAYIMPYYLKDSLGATPVAIGILYATANIVAAFTLLASGFFGDKVDRKKILILGWLLWIPAPLIFAFGREWTQMLPGMALWGIYLGPPVNAAYIITVAKREKLTSTLAVVSSAFPLGYVFSPALGGYLAGTVGMQPVFFSAFVFYSLATITLFFVKSQMPNRNVQTDPEKKSSRLGLLRNRRLLVMTVFFSFVMFTLLLFRPFVPTFLADTYRYGGFEIGVLGSFSFFGSAVLAVALGRIGDKFKKPFALATALVLVGFSLLVFLLVGDFRVLVISQLFLGAGYLSWPLMSAIVGPRAPESARAFLVAIPLTAGMFASTFAPYVGGVLYELSPVYPFVFGIIASLSLAAFAFAGLD
jgi:MFS family permease